jgi:hypothetical protein
MTLRLYAVTADEPGPHLYGWLFNVETEGCPLHQLCPWNPEVAPTSIYEIVTC